MSFAKADEVGASKHPYTGIKYTYGTAGFRTKADILDSVMYRVGLLAALRSQKHNGQWIAVMVTASHNPIADNGVKIVDPMGDMLEQSWEAYATTLANTDNGKLAGVLEQIVESEGIDTSIKARVIYGMDTRPSSPALIASLKDALDAIGAEGKDYGVVTTPILHFMVRCLNDGTYGTPTEEGYYSKLAAAFAKIKKSQANERPLILDCANGVGAPKAAEFLKVAGKTFPCTLVNTDIAGGKLNDSCGADFVKVQQAFPANVKPTPQDRCASFDGDADRIVYFYADQSGTFKLLDGDKIATLAGAYLAELVRGAGLSLNLGVVQTAYANGSSTRFLEQEMKVPVVCTPTGVKHLHHAAKHFDIGVYFEANGHGTIIFDPAAEAKIRSHKPSGDQKAAHDQLLAFVDVINQTVGDALSDCLVVEAILSQKGWTCADWDRCYSDLPNRQLKLPVKDRNAITTTDAERKCVTPPGLQDAIDQANSKYKDGRSFVRPSGTEDVVRVYAEAATRDQADELAYEVLAITHRLAGGVGDVPKKP